MPAVSEAQRGYLNARFGHGWVAKHGFDNPGKLPRYAKRKGTRRHARHTAVTHMLAAGRNR